ncbi:hypothetical protein C8J56DRAFT_988779, partial [Mycena floridula]
MSKTKKSKSSKGSKSQSSGSKKKKTRKSTRLNSETTNAPAGPSSTANDTGQNADSSSSLNSLNNLTRLLQNPQGTFLPFGTALSSLSTLTPSPIAPAVVFVPGRGFMMESLVNAETSPTEPIAEETPAPNVNNGIGSHGPMIALNSIFNDAIGIITSSLGANPIDQARVFDAIGIAAGNQFSVNLDAAIAQLMHPLPPRGQTVHFPSYSTEPKQERSTQSDRTHVKEKTPRSDKRKDRKSAAVDDNSAPARPQNEIVDPVALAARIWKDRVAIQRMVNADMRESGQSAHPDQGIAFDASGNPYDIH